MRLPLLLLVLAVAACKPDPAPVATPPVAAADANGPAPSPTYTQGYVVELSPTQTPADLRAAAEDVFTQVVSIEPLFPDVRPEDDPEGLARIHRVRVADAATGTCRTEARLGALRDQRPFELGDGAQHLRREHALRRGGVDRVAQGSEVRAARLELLDDREQVADGAGEAVEAHDDQGVAGPDVAQQPGQHGPAAVGAGGVLLQDGGAAGRVQLVALRVGALLLGRDPRIAQEPTGQAASA